MRPVWEWVGDYLERVVECVLPLCFLATIGGLIYLLVVSSQIQARVLNEKFGTEYTTSEIFFAGEMIQEIIIGDKGRLDVNLTK